MNTNFPDRRQTVEMTDDCVFNDLRQSLAREVPCMALSDLLESVNTMQRASRTAPAEFNLRFEEFVYRAEEYMAVVRPFFPRLVGFLSSPGFDDPRLGDKIEPRTFDDPAQTGVTAGIA
jgi:hypothetical protein